MIGIAIVIIQTTVAKEASARRLHESEIVLYLRDERGVHAFEISSDATARDLYAHYIFNRTGNDNRLLWDHKDIDEDDTPLADLGIGAESELQIRLKDRDSVSLFKMFRETYDGLDKTRLKLLHCFNHPADPHCSTPALCGWNDLASNNDLDLTFIECDESHGEITAINVIAWQEFKGRVAFQFVPESVKRVQLRSTHLSSWDLTGLRGKNVVNLGLSSHSLEGLDLRQLQDPLIHLEELDLSGNFIPEIDLSVFVGTNMKRLHLYQNELHSIDLCQLNGTSLEFLDISENVDLRDVDVDLKDLEGSSLRELLLECRNIDVTGTSGGPLKTLGIAMFHTPDPSTINGKCVLLHSYDCYGPIDNPNKYHLDWQPFADSSVETVKESHGSVLFNKEFHGCGIVTSNWGCGDDDDDD